MSSAAADERVGAPEEISQELLYAAHIRLPSRRAHTHQIMQMCEAFADQGCDVKLVVAGLRPLDGGASDLWDWYDVRRNFAIEPQDLPDLSLPAGRLPAPLTRLALLAAWRLSMLRFSLTVMRRLPANPAAILYSRDAFVVWLASRLWPDRARRMLFESHAFPRSLVGRWLHRSLDKRIGGIVTVTGHLADQYRQAGTAPDRLLVAHDGVRLERFARPGDRRSLRQEIGWPASAFIVGYAGGTQTLGEEKGLSDLVEAIGTFGAQNPGLDIRLAAVGADGEQANQLVNRLIDRGLPASTGLFPGWVKPSRLADYLRACDALTVPFPPTHHLAYEASPLKLFEYMAAGVPIVASSLPALAEILVDGQNALLAPAGDQAAFAAALGRLAHSPALGDKLGSRAQHEAKSYQWPARAARILAFALGPETPGPGGAPTSDQPQSPIETSA